MTKEEIINAVLNLDIVEIYDINDKVIISKSCVGYGGDIISVCSKGVLVIYNAANFECMYSIASGVNVISESCPIICDKSFTPKVSNLIISENLS